MKYLRFNKKGKNVVYIKNLENTPLGRLERIRVGAWMSWVLFLNPRCYLSASCQDEVREKTRKLNGVKK
jgi:hypothetical protein